MSHFCVSSTGGSGEDGRDGAAGPHGSTEADQPMGELHRADEEERPDSAAVCSGIHLH